MLSSLPHMMEDSWENCLSHLGVNHDLGCTNAVSFEDMIMLNNDSSNFNVVAAKQEYYDYYNNLKKSSEDQELGTTTCYWRKEGTVDNNHELELEAKTRENRGTKRARTSSETQYHIMSERKRRQDIAEKFIALSATIPGLKKVDKATVLREALNYMRELQERIAVLEKGSNNKSIKSLIITKSRPCSASSCETNSNEVLPEVEARGLEKEVLIRIYCEKRKGIMLKLFALLKDLHLSIASTSVLPFGNSILNIIIIAQMSEKYNLTVNDLVKTLKQIF